MMSPEHENFSYTDTPENNNSNERGNMRIITAIGGVVLTMALVIGVKTHSNKENSNQFINIAGTQAEQNINPATTEQTTLNDEVLAMINSIEIPAATAVQPAEQPAPESSVAVAPAPVAETAPAVVAKKVVKPLTIAKQTGIAATLNAYKVENGKKVCKVSEKNDNPGISSKGTGVHVDEDCCIDLDEIPNLNCYYAPTSSKKMNTAMTKAVSNITKKLGSKVKK